MHESDADLEDEERRRRMAAARADAREDGMEREDLPVAAESHIPDTPDERDAADTDAAGITSRSGEVDARYNAVRVQAEAEAQERMRAAAVEERVDVERRRQSEYEADSRRNAAEAESRIAAEAARRSVQEAEARDEAEAMGEGEPTPEEREKLKAEMEAETREANADTKAFGKDVEAKEDAAAKKKAMHEKIARYARGKIPYRADPAKAFGGSPPGMAMKSRKPVQGGSSAAPKVVGSGAAPKVVGSGTAPRIVGSGVSGGARTTSGAKAPKSAPAATSAKVRRTSAPRPAPRIVGRQPKARKVTQAVPLGTPAGTPERSGADVLAAARPAKPSPSPSTAVRRPRPSGLAKPDLRPPADLAHPLGDACPSDSSMSSMFSIPSGLTMSNRCGTGKPAGKPGKVDVRKAIFG